MPVFQHWQERKRSKLVKRLQKHIQKAHKEIDKTHNFLNRSTEQRTGNDSDQSVQNELLAQLTQLKLTAKQVHDQNGRVQHFHIESRATAKDSGSSSGYGGSSSEHPTEVNKYCQIQTTESTQVVRNDYLYLRVVPKPLPRDDDGTWFFFKGQAFKPNQGDYAKPNQGDYTKLNQGDYTEHDTIELCRGSSDDKAGLQHSGLFVSSDGQDRPLQLKSGQPQVFKLTFSAPSGLSGLPEQEFKLLDAIIDGRPVAPDQDGRLCVIPAAPSGEPLFTLFENN